ncbi:hypothetical protein [Hoylesella saccharolytica]|uniref:SDH family Clp fold serine proteinase n=1 Tax=Hoylesella saccharolytica TaxID=633701 RepID=UPI0023541806|nr:hypothetical protein [Hoylesella saccharolytica]
MPGWSEIMNEVQQHKQEDVPAFLLDECIGYLNNIKTLTGRNVIAYYSGWLKNNNPEVSINENDKNAFMNAVIGMDRAKGLDLILHTPGGDIAATEGIVTYLQSLFNSDIRAIIPQISMSAGTMIAISCKEIIMGRQSSLGPIDPQMQGIACQMVIDEFKRAVEEVKNEPASLGLWQTIIGKYPVTFLTSCEDAIHWSEGLAEEWLAKVDPNINIDKIKETFINHNHSYSHSRRISRENCRNAGLKISDLEKNQELQDAVLSLHHCYMILMDNIPALKLVMTPEGRAYIQTKQGR